MTDWDSYELFNPGVTGPPGSLSRRDAQGLYRLRMGSRFERIAQLGRLVADEGIVLDLTIDSLGPLEQWFKRSVQQLPNGRPGVLVPDWYSVVNDIGMYLGELLIERHPELDWLFLFEDFIEGHQLSETCRRRLSKRAIQRLRVRL